jgi:excisionase family DNA binding protein
MITDDLVLVSKSDLVTMINDAVVNALGGSRRVDPIRETGEPKYLKGYKELAAYLKVSKTTALKWKQAGYIPFSQKGALLLFDRKKVDEALINKQFKTK